MNTNGNSFSEQDLREAALYLKSKGMSESQAREILNAMRRGDVEMSRTDGVTMVTNQGDVPGVYISAEQKLQDAYASTPLGQRQIQMQDGMQGQPSYYTGVADLNLPFDVRTTVSPNTTVVTEGQRQTARPDGTIVIY